MTKYLTFSERLRDDSIIVYSEVTSVCNNKCSFCPIDKLERKGQMSPQLEERLSTLFADNPDKRFRIFFHLLGEPLLYRRLEEYIKRIDLPNTELWMATNGSLLTPNRLKSLHDAGLRNIWFSMFYTNAEDYEKLTRSDHYDTVVKNLKHLLSQHASFRRIHVVTFAKDSAELEKLCAGYPNVTLQTPRMIKEWRYDNKPILRSLFFHLKRLYPVKYLCITAKGDLTYEWQDYNAESSPGNVMTLSDADILGGYYRAGVLIRTRERFNVAMRRFLERPQALTPPALPTPVIPPKEGSNESRTA